MKRISMSFCLFTVKEQTNERKKKTNPSSNEYEVRVLYVVERNICY